MSAAVTRPALFALWLVEFNNHLAQDQSMPANNDAI
jgi:hypothetical protein